MTSLSILSSGGTRRRMTRTADATQVSPEGPPLSTALRSSLSDQIIGQPEVIEEIVSAYRIWRTGLATVTKPIASFLLLGPTGVGKTHTVESLAHSLHGDRTRLIRVDCGEFQADHEIAKLIGSPPGYIGFKDKDVGSVLDQSAIQNVQSPSTHLSLLLFDEIEKASPGLLRLLLGVLDHARLRMGNGSETDFSNCMIFMTSNLGAKELQRGVEPSVGFSQPTPTVSKNATSAARRYLSPEFFNRVDKILTFNSLTRAELDTVLTLELDSLQLRICRGLRDRAFVLHVEDSARTHLLGEGTDLRYGARQLKRTIERHLTYPLAEMIEVGSLGSSGCVEVSHTAGGGYAFNHA